MTKLRVGVIGLGLGQLHVDEYLKSEHVDAVVVCDPDEARRTSAIARDVRVASGFATLGEMLSSERLDAVSVVTPDQMHREHAELCFEAGVNVLLTKPISTNIVDATSIITSADTSGRAFMVAQECRFRSRFQFLHGLISSGRLGEIINIRLDSIWDKREQFTRAPWYASKENGRSIMVGTAIHEVDLLRYLVGLPVSVVAAFGNAIGDLYFPTEKTVGALFSFEGGAIGQVTASYEARWPANGGRNDQIRILGTKGAVVGNEYVLDGADWQTLPQDENEFATGVARSVSSFIDSLVTGRPVEVSGADALESLKLCLAVDEALRTGAPVALDGRGSK